MNSESKFEITGAVVRKFVANSGKFAKVVIGVPSNNRESKLEVRAFSAMVNEVQELTVGEFITVTGNVDSEVLKDKSKNDVKVDGYAAWVNVLTARSIKRHAATSSRSGDLGSHDKEKPAANLDDSDVPF